MNARSLALASCSGLLLAVSFPVVNLHFLAWIALVPLFVAVQGLSTRHAFLLGGVCGAVFFAGTIHWIANSITVYGNQPFIVSLLITFLLCACLAAYPALFAAGAVHVMRIRPHLFFLFAPSLWTTLELARTYLFTGFPWALLGYTQYAVLPIIQIADVTGVYGVSFLIVLINASIFEFMRDRKRVFPLVSAVLVTIVSLAYGTIRLDAPLPASGLRISVIQGNIEQDKKWDRAYQRETFSVYERLTREAVKNRPDLVIWPETSTPFYFKGNDPIDRAMTKDLSDFVQSIGTPLLFGSPTYDPGGGNPVVLHNNAFLLSADGTVAASYRKLHLVPFGEYVPLKGLLFFVEKMVQSKGEFMPGHDYTIMSLPGARKTDFLFNTVICYEIIFPDLVRTFVNKGARIVATITNDAWFGKTAAPYQHFSMAVFRAIENRVPVARAANTGISGFIDEKGHILASSGIFAESVLTKTLHPCRIKTFYTANGDIFSYLCILVVTGVLIAPRQKV